MLSAVDVQQLLLQSITVEKIQHAQQQHPDAQQKHLALQLNAERKLQQQKITGAEEAERTQLRDKEEQRRRKRMASARFTPGDGNSPDGAAAPSEEEQGEYIDIQV